VLPSSSDDGTSKAVQSAIERKKLNDIASDDILLRGFSLLLLAKIAIALIWVQVIAQNN